MTVTYYSDAPGRLMRALSARFRDGRCSWRMNWGEINFRPGFALALCLFAESGWSLHLHLFFVNLYINLPLRAREPKEIMESWGFSVHLYDVHFSWGDATKVMWCPWTWEQVRHEVLRSDGSFAPYIGSWEEGDDGRHTETYPYRYVCRDGSVQDVTATIYVEEREHRWRWLKWLPFPRRIYRAIDISFSDEVGEDRGSWKGGCVGCGYTMHRGEAAKDTLRRMERERRFGR